MRKLASKANVSRGTLKSIGDLVANALEGGDLSHFEKYSPGMFPKNYPQRLREQAAIVGELKSGKARQSERTDAVVNLKRLLPDILAGALRLADYIGEAFPETEHERRLEQCGYATHYEASSGKNWESVQKMGEEMLAFMASQHTVLRKGGIMPTGFPGELGELFGEFNTDYEKLKKAKASLTSATNANATEMNILEAMLAKIFKSARSIFRNDPVKRSFYTMNNFAKMLRPGATAGVRGKFFDAVSKLPIAGGKVSTPYHNLETLTGKDGRFSIDNLTEGEIPLNFEAKGYALFTLEKVKIRTGKKTTLKPIALQPLPAEQDSGLGQMPSPEVARAVAPVEREGLASIDLLLKTEGNGILAAANGMH